MANPTSLRKLGLPITRRTGAAQAAVAQTSVAVATTAATDVSPYGYTQAQADAIVAQLNAAVADIAALTTLVNELRTALINARLIKGSA
ncbi:MAG TPA: hypothetical protein VHD61_15710 [Lacunisphaera sp.]|nr:hypothetical protein [Lacunisphaera sp.]